MALIIISSCWTIAFAGQMQAPPIVPPGSGTLILPGSETTSERGLLDKLLPSITRTIIALAGALAVLFMIYGGIQILTAYGKPDKIEAAKKTITWAIAGLLIAILSYSIVSIIGGIRL